MGGYQPLPSRSPMARAILVFQVSLFWRDGRPQSRCFSATKYGFEGSKMLAMAKQHRGEMGGRNWELQRPSRL